MSFLTKISNIIGKKFSQYKNLTKIINKKTTSKETLKSTFFAVILVAVIYFIPLALVINLFIFNNLRLLLTIILLLIFVSLGFIYFKIYYKLLKTYNNDLEAVNLKTVSNIEGIILALVLFILGLVVITQVY